MRIKHRSLDTRIVPIMTPAEEQAFVKMFNEDADDNGRSSNPRVWWMPWALLLTLALPVVIAITAFAS